jgi:AAA15 family ATPase/GTPase
LKEYYFTYREGNQTIHIKKTIAIYGANASGKSNIVKAFNVFRNMIMVSIKTTPNQKIKFHEPFLLDEETPNQPTFFELDYAWEGNSYCYGFSYNQNEIIDEYLYAGILQDKPTLLFKRSGKTIELGDEKYYERQFSEHEKMLNAQLLENELLLTKEARNNQSESRFTYLLLNSAILSFIFNEEKRLQKHVTEKMLDGGHLSKELVQKILYLTDFDINDFRIETTDHDAPLLELPDDQMNLFFNSIFGGHQLRTITTHQYQKKDGSIENVRFDMEDHESEGTQKMFAISEALLTSLIYSSTTIADELNNSFHPAMTRFIIDLFHHPESNPNNAQLLFTTHDTEFIDLDIFNPDQIYFVEKDRKTQASLLYSLADFDLTAEKNKGKTKFEDWYLADRFGATPAIGFFVLPEEYRKNKQADEQKTTETDQ